MPSTSLTFASTAEHRAWLAAQARLPAGFRVGKHRFGFTAAVTGKPATMTLTLIALDQPTPDFAAVYTRNAFPGAPVLVGRRRLEEPALGAILINNKISNVCAPGGVETAERLCAAAGKLLGLPGSAVLPSSTGIIGWSLPEAEMLAQLPAAAQSLQAASALPLAEGIVTTDLYPKLRRADFPGGGCLIGAAKGAGMISPNLATMLVYLLTDVPIPRERLRALLREAVRPSFNGISIDTDQSTSDTVALLSSGRAAPVPEREFAAALHRVCADLAEDVVRNGEGVQHVVRCTVRGAPDHAVAHAVGKSVINSPLLQCAIAGNDPNVGRLVCAIGKELGDRWPAVGTERVRIELAGETVYAEGAFRLDPAREARLSAALAAAQMWKSAPPDAAGVFKTPIDYPPHERAVEIRIDLGQGDAAATVIGCDRTHEYISENADYRS